MNTENTAPDLASEADTLAALGDLDLGDLETDIEEIEEEIGAADVQAINEDEVDDDELRDLELQEDRDATYAEQETEVGDADADAVAEKKAEQAAKPKRANKANTPKSATPRAPRDLNSVPAEVFVLEGDVSAMDDAAKDAAKTATMAAIPAQKKIAEKFENLFTALNAGKQPSVYVVQAFKLLDEKKSLTQQDIVASFKGTYKQGTAMSQAGQIMNLFAAVKIAERVKSTLTLNANSNVAQRLRDVIAAAKAP